MSDVALVAKDGKRGAKRKFALITILMPLAVRYVAEYLEELRRLWRERNALPEAWSSSATKQRVKKC